MTIRDDRLVHEILENDGITLDTNTNQIITATTGYMVSIEGKEEVHSMRIFSRVGKFLLDCYIEKNRHLLREPEHFLGVWVEGNSIYFDVSQRIVNKAEAIFIGTGRKQIAIFELATNKVEFL